MTNVGTVSRHIRCYSLLGGVCYLILSSIDSVQAAVNPNGFEVLSSKSTGVKSGQYIEAAVSAVYQHGGTAGNQGVYTKQMVPVSTSTLRKGALSALGRGVMHPGFQVALLAAGYIVSGLDIFQEETGEYFPDGFPTSCDSYRYSNTNVMSGYFPDPFSAALALEGTKSFYYSIRDFWNTGTSCNGSTIYKVQFEYQDGSTALTQDIVGLMGTMPNKPAAELTSSVDLDSTAFHDNIEPHIPPHLYDELWNGGPIPEWQDEITVLGAPATYVQPTGDQAVAPEVASQIGKWGENVGAQLDGEPLPNPETDAAGKTSTDSLYEELGLDDPVPPFPSAEPEWQVETIDSMPSWSAGIGEASCPPPTQIQLWGGMSFEISYTPLCDFAGFIRAVVIGVAGFAALYIVLGARS